MTDSTLSPAPDAIPAPEFTTAPVRPRHDGWTPARQVAFIQALADTACVDEAARRVGMSRESCYTLRRRPGAASFRQAWDVALDHAITRLADAALGRALHGTATPVFYKGEQIGERRRYDERLTMFLLRYRDPQRYGAWRDTMVARRPHPDGAARLLEQALRHVAEDGPAVAAGRLPPPRAPLRTECLADDPDYLRERADAAQRADQERRETEWEDWLDTLERERAATPATGDSAPDVV